MFHRLLVVLDVITNFWCIILSYNGYNAWYMMVCQYFHLKCTACWHRIVQTERIDPKEININLPNIVKVRSVDLKYNMLKGVFEPLKTKLDPNKCNKHCACVRIVMMSES